MPADTDRRTAPDRVQSALDHIAPDPEALGEPAAAIRCVAAIRELAAQLEQSIASAYTIYTPGHAADILQHAGAAIETLGSVLTLASESMTKAHTDGHLAEQGRSEAYLCAAAMERAADQAAHLASDANRAGARVRGLAEHYTGYPDPGAGGEDGGAYARQHAGINRELASLTGVSTIRVKAVEDLDDEPPRLTAFTYAGARWRLLHLLGWSVHEIRPDGAPGPALRMRYAAEPRIHPRLIALEALIAIDDWRCAEGE